MKSSKTIWSVKTGDEEWAGHNFTYLLAGPTAASVEKRALALAQLLDKNLARGENKCRPYIRSIELVGELAD